MLHHAFYMDWIHMEPGSRAYPDDEASPFLSLPVNINPH